MAARAATDPVLGAMIVPEPSDEEWRVRTVIPDLRTEVEIPVDGTISRKLFEDDQLRLVVFGFDAGQELTEHTSSAEVVVQVVSGQITLTVDGTAHAMTPASWLVLEPRRPHSLRAEEPSVVLLTLVGARS